MLFVDILGYTLSSDAVCCIILSPMICMKAMMVIEIQEVNIRPFILHPDFSRVPPRPDFSRVLSENFLG